MDGGIVNPGDFHGRVLPANDVCLSWDGNQICALVGPDLVVGVSGFGDTVHDALRDLADNLIREGVWVEIEDRAECDFGRIEPSDLNGRIIQTNEVELCYSGANRICAFGGPDDVHVGVSGLATQSTTHCGIWRIIWYIKVSGLK